jgi:hypothetical protein
MRLLIVALLLTPRLAGPQTAANIAIPADSAHWAFEGGAGVADYLGRRCIMLEGGAATVKDLDLRDGVIDLDVATSAKRGFFGIQFRTDSLNGDAGRSPVHTCPQYRAQLAALQWARLHRAGGHSAG